MRGRINLQNIFLAAMLVLAGCNMLGCGAKMSAEDAEGAFQPRERIEFDLASNQWKEQGETEDSGEPWQYTEYWEDSVLGDPEPDKRYHGRWSVACDSDFYWLECRLAKEIFGLGVQKCYLTRLNTVTMEAERTEFRFSGVSDKAQNLGRELLDELVAALDEGWLVILGMDIVDEKVCLLAKQIDSESKAVSRYYVIWTDAQGMVERVVDLLPEVERAGLRQVNYEIGGILCDKDGYLYIESPGLGSFGIFDKDGTFLRMAKSPGGTEDPVFHMGRLPDGRPVFGCNKADSVILFCYEDGEEKLLYHGRCAIPEKGYFNNYGEILFMENGCLMRWDAATGKCQRLYQERGVTFQDVGIEPFKLNAIIENSGGEITLIFYDISYGVTMAMKVRLGAEVEETTLTIFQMRDDQNLRRRMDEYRRRHPGIKIELTSPGPDEDFDMALARLMAQLSQNNGPDLIFLRVDQLEYLQKEGVLADLTGVLPQEVEEQIFSGVLRCCMVDGKLYGLVSTVTVSTIAVSEDVWPGDTWTWRDVMALMEGGGRDGEGFASVFGDLPPLELLKTLVMRDIAGGTSSFLDYEKKQCYFDSEDFVGILEFCQKYGSESMAGEDDFEEEIKKVQDGKTLAYQCVGTLRGFSRCIAALGEGYKCVGYPTEGEYGGYFECYDCLSVNANTPKRDLAYEILRYLLGDEGQRQMGIFSVRKDILLRYVEDGTEPDYEPIFRSGKHIVTPLFGRPDGSSFLPEYMEILEKGMRNLEVSPAEMIIIEEAAAYFAGDRTAEKTAEIIQNRVQLYLNEM